MPASRILTMTDHSGRANGYERILLLGATSITGFALARLFPDQVLPVGNPFQKSHRGAFWRLLRIEDRDGVRSLIEELHFDAVIYCHAVCDVVRCEANPGWAHDINVNAVEFLLGLLAPSSRVLYLSSDHVFGCDGAYTEDSPPCPVSAYGRTRVEAEARVLGRSNSLVVRTGLPIGPSVDGRTGHLDWLRHRHEQGLPMTVIEDESRSVVRAEDLAGRLMGLLQSDCRGLRHVPASEVLSRPQLASLLNREQGLPDAFRVEPRHRQPAPHIGQVEILSKYRDRYAQPLPALTRRKAPGLPALNRPSALNLEKPRSDERGSPPGDSRRPGA